MPVMSAIDGMVLDDHLVRSRGVASGLCATGSGSIMQFRRSVRRLFTKAG